MCVASLYKEGVVVLSVFCTKSRTQKGVFPVRYKILFMHAGRIFSCAQTFWLRECDDYHQIH